MADSSGTSKTLILSLFLLLGCNTVEGVHKVQDPDSYNKVPALLNHFLDISKPNRTVGSPGHERAYDFIKGQFDEIATEVKGRVIIHEFDPDIDFAKKNYQNDFDTLVKPKFTKDSTVYKKWKTFTDQAIQFVQKFQNIKGRNIILEIPGRVHPEEVVYIGAHYDTIDNDHQTLQFLPNSPAPGADDNGSAIAALLTMARELRNEKPDRTLRFIAFDYEEIFFLGSYALAKDLNSLKPRWMRLNEQTLGLVNLEMIGWSKTKLANHPVVKLYTRTKDSPGADIDSQMAKTYLQAAFLLKSPLKPVMLQNGFNRSDNWSFWQKSFPALCISEDWEKDFNETHYHTPTDTPDTLNYEYLKEITRVSTEAVSEMSHNMSFNRPQD